MDFKEKLNFVKGWVFTFFKWYLEFIYCSREARNRRFLFARHLKRSESSPNFCCLFINNKK